MGLSVIALAGVMAGLAAVVGPGRAGRALLLAGLGLRRRRPWACCSSRAGVAIA